MCPPAKLPEPLSDDELDDYFRAQKKALATRIEREIKRQGIAKRDLIAIAGIGHGSLYRALDTTSKRWSGVMSLETMARLGRVLGFEIAVVMKKPQKKTRR